MSRHKAFALFAISFLLTLAGCKSGPELVPFRGKVLYQGKPLQFGNVMFQPEGGQPSMGDIQPDGTFEMQTPGLGEGAVVGKNLVRITCFESQRPSNGSAAQTEMALGNSLIPTKYNNFNTSELTVEVHSGENELKVFDLK